MCSLLIILMVAGFQMMRFRSHQINNQLEQQKMTEMVQQISQNEFKK